MDELIGPAIVAALVIGFFVFIGWDIYAAEQARVECMSLHGMYLEGICVRGDIVQLGRSG